MSSRTKRVHLKSFAYVLRTDLEAPKLLIFRSHEVDGFEVPRGGGAPGESAQQCAEREAFEESGLTNLRLIAFLGRVQWHDQDQHFFAFHIGNPPPPAEFVHTVSGRDSDRGLSYAYHWQDVTPALKSLLVEGCGTYVDALLKLM